MIAKWLTVVLLASTVLACTYETSVTQPLTQTPFGDTPIEGKPMFDDEGQTVNLANNSWSASGNLITGNTNKKVQAQANFPKAGEYTIQFNIDQAQGSNTAAHTEASITWSVQGNSVQRRVSVVNGTSVTGVGEAIKVVLYDVSVFVGGTGDIDPVPYNVSLQVAPGARSTTNAPPTWVPPGQDPNSDNQGPGVYVVSIGTAKYVDIPLDAGVNSVFVSVYAFNAGSGAPAVLDGPAALVSQMVPDSISPNGLPTMSYDPRAYPWVPLVPGATQIRLRNANTTTGIAYYYYVAFGVDG